VEILKDRATWYRDCRSSEVFTMFPAGNGGTIELVYTQVKNQTWIGSFIYYILSIVHKRFVCCRHMLQWRWLLLAISGL